MPRLDGYQTVRRLRRREAGGQRLVVIAVTGDEEARERCLAAGMDDYLVKPLDGDEIAEKHQPEGVEIAPDRHLAGGLLRRHVGRRAAAGIGARHRRHPEVDQPHPALDAEHHIGRLEIPVQDPLSWTAARPAHSWRPIARARS